MAAELSTAPTVRLVDALLEGDLDLAVIHHPAVLGDLPAGPAVAWETVALVPAGHASDGSSPVRGLPRLPVALPPRGHGPAAHDLLVDTLEERGLPVLPVTATDDRAALAMVAAGQAIAFTADPDIDAPAVRRIRISDAPVLLRLRLVWRDAAHAGTAEALTAVLTEAGGT